MDTQIEVSAPREETPAGAGAFGQRGAAATVWAEMVEGRRRLLADVIDGRAEEVDVGDLTLAVELDVPQTQSDHMRLLRAASLAIQYQREDPAGRSEAALRKRLALVFGVDAAELGAYELVLGREIRYREKTGSSPLSNLPRLVGADLPEPALPEPLALPAGRRSKRDPSEYVALAEEGLNNTEIARRLGDVSEASVRRGLSAAGYERPR
jgi:hypothetical protein